MKKILYTLCIAILCMACNSNPETTNLDMAGMFSGSSPRSDARFADSQAYNSLHGIDTIQANSDEYRIYVCTDTHVDSTRYNLEQFIMDYHLDSHCPLALHLGDLINAQRHFAFMHEAFDAVPRNPEKKDTILVVAGNHDIYFGQWEEYKKYWKTSSYYFLVQTPSGDLDFFLMFDSAEPTLGVQQLEWLKKTLQEASRQPFRHRIVCTHTHPFYEDHSQGHTSNYALEETYELLNTFSKYGVEYYLCGHDHSREITEYKGCKYIIIDALEDPDPHAAYMTLSMGKDIHYDFVSVSRK